MVQGGKRRKAHRKMQKRYLLDAIASHIKRVPRKFTEAKSQRNVGTERNPWVKRVKIYLGL